MKFDRFLYLIFFIASFLLASCTSEEEPLVFPDPEMEEEMDMDGDDDLVAAPTFALTTTTGESIASTQFEDKTLVIFFFGFNCPPCKAVGPDIESRLHEKFKDSDNFAIIGADQWEGNNAGVDNFQSTTGITFPLGTNGADMAKDFGTTYDRLVVVNSDGKIAYKGNSIATNNLDEVVDLVEGLLK